MRVVQSQKEGNLYLNQNVKPSYQSLEDLFSIVEKGKRVWEATFDAISDPVLIISKDFTIKRANLAAARAAKTSIEDLIERPCYEIFAKQESICLECPVQLHETKIKQEKKIVHIFPDGREYIASAYPIKDKSGEGLGLYVLQYQDVTEIRKLEAQLIQKEKMAAIGLFTSGLAHDINNPIAGILAFAQLAKEATPTESEIYSDLNEIENAANRCKKIVEDLLTLSKPLKNIERQYVDISQLIMETLPSIEVQWQHLDYQLETNLPQLSQVRVNAAKLQQVFSNILLNAFQAISQGGKIKISAQENDEKLCIQIKDNGIGISESHLKQIFDPYFTTKRDVGGTGLGLPATYNIIREHGGHIEVQSEIGQGSCFKIFIPKGRSCEKTHSDSG